ncbi:macro domain-containing protein [Paenibacillus abyssi]|uniref:Macro domain-containing protein n=1 Tax=Paenibacillus abyssi TaxID=1340531 RepID=A0A917FM19_9BACL|nr:macro domain-containing protein [Paenibacillus abyssi]GGF90872.1 hypothetical protein GCM10010916_05260 [Paenibacillus abyssi]
MAPVFRDNVLNANPRIAEVINKVSSRGNAADSRRYQLGRIGCATVGHSRRGEGLLNDERPPQDRYREASEIPDIKSVAFCAISTGVFGFPKAEAAQIAVETVNDWLNTHDHRFERIVFNVYSDEDYLEYLRVFTS